MSTLILDARPALITELPKAELVVTAPASAAPVRNRAWAMFGSNVSKCKDAREVMEVAGMDYQVDLAAVNAEIPGLGTVQVPDTFATYRTDTGAIFGAVGKLYTPVQNEEAFGVLNAIIGEDAVYETAGVLKGGAIAYVTIEVPGYIAIKGQDTIAKYLLVVLNHDGKGAVRILFTPVRVICENTLRAALKMQKESGDLSISIRHTASAQDRMKEAHRVLGITNRLADELEGILGTMTKVKMTTKETTEYFEKVVLNDTFASILKKNEGKKKSNKKGTEKEFEISTKATNIVTKMEEYYEAHPTQQMSHMRGTVYGAYQAVTGYYQNVKNFNNAEDMMSSNVLGANGLNMQKAYELAWEAVGVN